MTDTLGLLVRVQVHPANLQDRAVVPFLLEGIQEPCTRIRHAWVDTASTGSAKRWMQEQLHWSVEVVQHPSPPRGIWAYPNQKIDFSILERPKGFQGVLPRRWVVERTFAWFSLCRRLSKDYEFLPQSSESWIYASMIRLVTRRLARAGP